MRLTSAQIVTISLANWRSFFNCRIICQMDQFVYQYACQEYIYILLHLNDTRNMSIIQFIIFKFNFFTPTMTIKMAII